jgi:hypothetical protein
MLLLLTLFSVLSFNETVQTQEASTLKPNQWKSLVLNQSTPEEAITLLGQPAKKEITGLIGAWGLGGWVTANHKDKRFQSLEYKNIPGMKSVRLQYLEGKLTAIYFEFADKEAPKPSEIATAYGTPLYPILQTLTNLSPEDFIQNHKARIDQGIITPVNYGTVYTLIGLSKESFVVCQGYSGVFNNQGSTVSFPGKAISLALISRTLETKNKATNLLR